MSYVCVFVILPLLQLVAAGRAGQGKLADRDDGLLLLHFALHRLIAPVWRWVSTSQRS